MISLVDIFFNFINVAILISLLIYFFKKNVIPSVRAQIRSQHVAQEHFISSINHLEATQETVEKEIIEQQYLYAELEHKVMFWKKSYEIEKDEALLQRLRRIEFVEHKRALQNKNFTYSKIQEIVVSQAITQAHAELIKLFHTPDAASSYIDPLIEHLKKS